MLLKLSVLFFTPLLSGLLIYLLPTNGRTQSFRLLLVFAGAYLFALTITHILPELYAGHGEFELIGVFVLLGFFLQQVLEYFSSGIEHGHIHTSPGGQKGISSIMLLLALCVHAFLEGGLLAQPLTMGPMYDLNAILLGIALHRAPAAFALMAVLTAQLNTRTKANVYLVIFSLAAPAGLLISTFFVATSVLSEKGLLYLYALVSGNFLHISTTIVFESSPEHRFNAKKLMVAAAGAASAIAIEHLV